MDDPVSVDAYSGARGEEEPRSFVHGGERIEVMEIVERWREPAGRFFRLRGSDGRRWLLFCRESDFAWFVRDPFRRQIPDA